MQVIEEKCFSKEEVEVVETLRLTPRVRGLLGYLRPINLGTFVYISGSNQPPSAGNIYM